MQYVIDHADLKSDRLLEKRACRAHTGKEQEAKPASPRQSNGTAVAPEPRAFRIPGGISIGTEPSAEALSALRAAETIGRPAGSAAFLDRLAALTGPRSAFETARPEARELGIE